MLYFEIRPALALMSDAEKGQILDAILNYGHDGILPEFGEKLGMAWSFIRPKIDRDLDAYLRKSEKNQKAAQARWRPKKPDDDIF